MTDFEVQETIAEPGKARMLAETHGEAHPSTAV